jgi:phosphate uptake regulator
MSRQKQKSPGPPSSASEAAARLAAIVEAAERAAAKVIDDAEEEARRRVEEADERADRIVAERLRAIADELDPESEASSRAPHLKPVASPAEGEDVPREGDELGRRRASAAGARLLATQMAVSGASRGEIEGRLRSEFDIEDTDGILDAILGPEG